MKTNPSCAALTRVLLFVALLPVVWFPHQVVFGRSLTADVVANPAAEQYVQEQLLAGHEANLADAFPDESQRVISGEFLSELILDSRLYDKPEIHISNTVIVGDIFDTVVNLPFDVVFEKCHFLGRVDMGRTNVQNFRIEYSVIDGAIRMDRAIVHGDLSFAGSTMQQAVGMYGTEIAGDLLGYDAIFNATKPDDGMSFPAEFWTIEVGHKAYFANAVFKGEIVFEESLLNSLDFHDAVFENEASFKDTSVTANATFENAKFHKSAGFANFSAGNFAYFMGVTFGGAASFEHAVVARHADFSNAVFDGEAGFDYFEAQQFVDFIETTFNQGFSFSYTTVGWPYFRNSTFNGPTYFDGMQASADFEITESHYTYKDEPLFLYLINVGGSAWLYDISAPAGIDFTAGQVANDLEIKTKDNPKIVSIDLTDTKVGSQLLIQDVQVETLRAEGLSVGESTHLTNLNVTKSLDMRNVKVGFLEVIGFKWPEDPTAFNLRGMTFSDIDLGDKGLTEETWIGLLHLVNTSAYSPQAYKTLEQFLAEKGHPAWAAEVNMAAKRRERDQVLTPLTGPWLWSWFMEVFSGYGHRPFLAFIWGGLVIALGAIIYRRREDMLPVDQDSVQVEYNPILYSFALFLPYVDLGIAAKWEPNPARKWARYYKYTHMLLGWVLTPIALLTFGGILG